MDSVQWKACCWVLDLPIMDYRIVQLVKDKATDIYGVKNSVAMQMVWSEKYMDTLLELVDGLILFHQAKGLEKYMLPYERSKHKNKP